MSEGLNTAFMKDPEHFLGANYWSIEGAAYDGQQRLRYTLDGEGVGQFDLCRHLAGLHSVSLRNFSNVGFFEKGWFEEAITAYYLPSRTDQDSRMHLLRKAKYFFTDIMNGCSFLAYGNNRHGVTVEHNNRFTNGPQSMRPYENGIAGQQHPFFVLYNSDNYRQTPLRQGEQGESVLATVFGLLKTDGWHFFACRCIKNWGGTSRLIGIGALEI